MDEFDWQKFNDRHALRRAVVDPRRRLRFCAAMAMVLFGLVFLRAAQLELSYGKAFRTEAAQPLRREKTLPGVRGRILAADGTVLACDREIHSLAVHYRYLQEPADQSWLRYTARRRLTPTERKDPRRLAAEQQRVLAERRAMIQRICRLCGISAEQWHTRARAIQRRVEYIAETVNRRYRRRREGEARQTDDAYSHGKSLGRLVHEALQSSVAEGGPQRITVAEELDYHVMVDDVPLEVVAQIEARPRDFPGVKIVTRTRRHYPRGPLAAHVLGYLARVGPEELAAGYHPDDYVGRSGVEASYQHVLHGRRGLEVELVDRTGRLVERRQKRPPGVGRDVVLTIVPPLQQAAETLLDSAVERRRLLRPEAPPGGGAVVVMDVNTGALLALAGTPRFDPNVFMAGDHEAIDCLVHSPDKPLFNRPVQMALPPGSVFKVVSAVALLEAGQVEPHDPLLCRGYLHRPTQWRCAVFVRRGVGHGEVDLARALAVSCNVYFFQHAEQLGCRPLLGWARRFGFGQPTGVDLPAEASGRLPDPSKIEKLAGHPWRVGDTLSLAIGQGTLAATPLQVARLIAAVANGGRLVRPHVVSRLGNAAGENGSGEETVADWPGRRDSEPIAELGPHTLETIRRGLCRVVADPEGTAHKTVFIEQMPIAGKTGTAQTGPGRPAHAWFAGYVPAGEPRYAVVAVLEYGGDAATAVGPVVRHLVVRMMELGLLGPNGAARESAAHEARTFSACRMGRS